MAKSVRAGSAVAMLLVSAVLLLGALVSAVSVAEAAAVPTTPTSCVATRTGTASTATITFTRAPNDNATRFIIERSRNNGTWYWAGKTDPPTTQFTNTGLRADSTYTYRVKTKANNQNSSATECSTEGGGPAQIVLDVQQLLPGEVEEAVTGLNLNFLLDSDLHRPRAKPNIDAINDLSADVLRFPFGHLADNYLWDVAPFGGVLTPRIASQSESPGLSANDQFPWSWAVRPDGSFIDAMDFDEFIDLSLQTGTSTLVVVNAAAHKYADGPTYEELKQTAVEWVRYANEQGYEVGYWQIGNEADSASDGVLTAQEYAALYSDFAQAMKAQDPTINVGPGIIGANEAFTTSLLAAAATEMDFISAHQYARSSWRNYVGWRGSGADPAYTITRVQQRVAESASPDLPILITETNSSGGNWDEPLRVTTYKALAFFDMLISGQQLPNVVTSFMWTSHSPWRGEHEPGGVANAFFNDTNNGRTPNGEILRIFAETVEPRFVQMQKRHGFINAWSSTDPDSGSLTIYLLNRDSVARDASIELQNYSLAGPGTRSVFGGSGPQDPEPTYRLEGAPELTATGVSTTVPAASLVVLDFDTAVPDQ